MLKKFESINTKQENRITVTGGYAIGFPTKFYLDNNINTCKYGVLFYDEESLEIGIYFTNDDNEKFKYILRHDTKGRGGSLAVKSLLKTLNIVPEDYKGKYEWEKRLVRDTGDVYVIKLKKRVNKILL